MGLFKGKCLVTIDTTMRWNSYGNRDNGKTSLKEFDSYDLAVTWVEDNKDTIEGIVRLSPLKGTLEEAQQKLIEEKKRQGYTLNPKG